MIRAISNQARDYSWGKVNGISALFETVATNAPEAELWFGAHPLNPSQLLSSEGSSERGALSNVAELIETEPAEWLAKGSNTFPFLLKLLSVNQALSIQVHPTTEQAKLGFELENSARVPLTASNRNYKDSSAKPEFALALTGGAEALAGFRSDSESLTLLKALSEVLEASSKSADSELLQPIISRLQLTDPELLKNLSEWILINRENSSQLALSLTEACNELLTQAELPAALAESSELLRLVKLVQQLGQQYPGDPGILIALLLSHHQLAEGEAIFLDAGILHAYLSGDLVELMAPSDNVLRGGLTPKHIDVPELLKIMIPKSGGAKRLEAEELSEGFFRYQAEQANLQLYRFYTVAGAAGNQAESETAAEDKTGAESERVSAELALEQVAIAICLEGDFKIQGLESTAQLRRGSAVLISASEKLLKLQGQGKLFLATAAV